MESFDTLEKKAVNKPCCSDCSSSSKTDKNQTDDAYIPLSELCACDSSSKFYTYMDSFFAEQPTINS